MTNELYHHGVKGQKWGVRRYQNKDGSLTSSGKKRYRASIKTSSGEEIHIIQNEKSRIAKFIAKRFPKAADLQQRSMDASIVDSNGKKVGYLSLYNEGNNSLNVNWVSINKNSRGKGYASAVMNNVVKYAKNNGYKQITLEVPGDSPDAKHIYEKVGFKSVGTISDEDDVWGGLTAMKMDIFDDELKHHGIKGQRWGVRRFQKPNGSLTPKGRKRYSGKSNDSDLTIKKGTTAFRIANQDDDLNNGRVKYVSITQKDRETYSGDLLKGLFLDYSKVYGEHILNVKKDLRTKKGNDVISDLIDKYGSDDASSLREHLNSLKAFQKTHRDAESRADYINNGSDQAFEQDDWEAAIDAWSSTNTSYDKVRDFVWDTMKAHGNEVTSDYKSKGYDAIIDPYDYIANVSDMPVIVLDPSKSLERRGFTRFG